MPWLHSIKSKFNLNEKYLLLYHHITSSCCFLLSFLVHALHCYSLKQNVEQSCLQSQTRTRDLIHQHLMIILLGNKNKYKYRHVIGQLLISGALWKIKLLYARCANYLFPPTTIRAILLVDPICYRLNSLKWTSMLTDTEVKDALNSRKHLRQGH